MRNMLMFFFSLLLPGLLAAEDIEIVVTASRVEEETEKVPAMVSVITAEDLAASGRTTLVEALDGLAGIHFRSSSGNAAQAEVAMRGFGENSFGRVLVLVDGRKLNRPDMAGINWLQIPLENVERVEVVRGGNSVLYGDHAVAGVINVITKKGGKKLSVDASVIGGSFGLNQERLGIRGPAGPVEFSLNGEHTSEQGYRDRSAYRSIGGSARLGAELGALGQGSLALSYNRLTFQLPGYLTSAEVAVDPTLAGDPSNESAEQHLGADLGLSTDWTDRLQSQVNLTYGLKVIQSDIVSWSYYTDQTIHTFGATPRFSIDLLTGAMPDRLIVGADGYYDLLGIQRFTDAGRGTMDLEVQVSKLTAGAYAQNELTLGEHFILNAGLRYDLGRIAARTLQTLGVSIDEESLHQAFVYDAGLTWLLGAGGKVYARFGTLYRYPFTDEQVSIAGFAGDAFLTDLRAEKGWEAEAGAELAAGDALKAGGSFFWTEMRDEIGFNSVTFRNENLDLTRHLGAEVNAAWSPAVFLKVTGSYTYSLATFRAGANKGRQIPLVPNHQARLESDLRLPLGFSLGVTGSYTGEMFAGGDFPNAQPAVPGYFMLGAALRYHPSYLPGNLELYFQVENLLDTLYYTNVYYNAYALPPVTGYYPAPGRSVKVGGSYRY